MEKIGILVVVYNNKTNILNWLAHYKKKFSKDPSLYLLVLDNNSTDGTYNAVTEQYPDVDIRRLRDNYGCTTARNVGIVELIENIGCDIYASFDDDVIIEDENFFNKIRNALNTCPEVDGYCGILRWGDDRSICTMGGRKTLIGVYKTIKKISGHTKVDYMPGGACVIRASTFEKFGLYDNDFPPIGGQDKNWGIRVSKRGANLCYNPNVELFHYHNRNKYDSCQKHGYVIQGRVLQLRKQFSLSMFLYMIIFAYKTSIKQFGFKFAIEHFRKAMCQKLNPGNYNYEKFKVDYKKYYA